ncbi:HigA family addiction module antitoxin, partial [Mycobacterium sp. THU-M104]|uniref:HigA family addiction module antitoxin n=2 Tax=unclassified Mycobacterium TaxID=2642494 RepID=UPI003B9BD224
RSTITSEARKERVMADFAPTHPGEILLTEFLEPMGISQYRVAKAIDVPPRRINEIVHGKRGISADTALRLSRALGLTDMFFINMQAHYDAEIAREQLANTLARIGRIA